MLALLKKKKWLVIIGAVVLLLVVGAAAAWFLYFKPAQEAAEKAAQQPPPPLHKEPFEALWALPSLEIPISGRMGARTLKVTFSLRLDNAGLEDELSLRQDEVEDGVRLLLSGRSVEEMEKNENRIRLKYDVLRLINGLVETGRVRGVYVTEFLIL